MSKDDRPSRGGLRLGASLFENECGRAGAGEQLAPAHLERAATGATT